MRLKARYQILLLVVVVLAVYYSALSAGVNSVDDSHIIAAYEAGTGKGLADIFRPGGSYYYRPLLELSFYLDNMLWAMHPRFMHFENVLLHCLNTMLVFILARQLSGAWSIRLPSFSFACALLFAVHPINSESVTWIAGRSDVLAGVFVLAAICSLLQCLITDRLLFLCAALLLFALGILTKEVALCFLPVAWLLTFFWPVTVRSRPLLLRLLALLGTGCLLSALLLVAFSPTLSVAAVLKNHSGGKLASVQTIVSALGFYGKKLFLPLPLNFAIDAVSALYLLPGIVFLLMIPFWLKRRHLPAVLASACGIFLLPALVVSVGQVAWTPFAERYLYLPSSFFCIGLTCSGSLFFERIRRQQWLLPVAIVISCAAAFVTVQRNLVWHDNVSLYQDTVRKSPGFGAAHLELGVAFLLSGQVMEGRRELETAERLNKRPSLGNLIKANLMAVRLQEGNSQGARDYFCLLFSGKEQADPEFLYMLNKADELLAGKASDVAARNKVYGRMIDTYDVLYKKTHDPFNLYQGGKLAFECGDTVRALAYLRKAVREVPPGTHYTSAASIWLQKLEAGQ